MLDIINHIKHVDPSWEAKMMNGGCYKFAKLLLLIQPEGELIKVQYQFPEQEVQTEPINHILFKHNNRLYDITGDVTSDYSEPDVIAPLEPNDIEIFKMNNWGYQKVYRPKNVGAYPY